LGRSAGDKLTVIRLEGSAIAIELRVSVLIKGYLASTPGLL
jgi:hypothetical protein